MTDTKTYLEQLKQAENAKLVDLKKRLDQGLETLKDALSQQRIRLGLSLYGQLKAQVEQTNNEAYQMYERKMAREYPSETLRTAMHNSAKVQLESMLRTGRAILENFERNHLR